MGNDLDKWITTLTNCDDCKEWRKVLDMEMSAKLNKSHCKETLGRKAYFFFDLPKKPVIALVEYQIIASF